MPKLAIKGGKRVRNRPFSPWPIFGEDELTGIVEVLKTGNWSYYGRKHKKQTEFAKRFATLHDCEYGICTSSGAAALEISLKAGGIGYRDEVLVPALTFAASASAALYIGASPVFVDVDQNTYCMDMSRAEEALTPKTKTLFVEN